VFPCFVTGVKNKFVT